MLETETDRIARQFLDATLPLEEWSHHAHLRVGLWHLLHYSAAEALDRLRVGIRSYNAACGVANTDTSGYHETITRLYVVLIAHFLDQRDYTEPVDELAFDLIEAIGDTKLPFTYYSRERLMSKEARRRWVEPDIRSVPRVASAYF